MQVFGQNNFGNFQNGNFQNMGMSGNQLPGGGTPTPGGIGYPPGSEMDNFLAQLNSTVATALQGPTGQNVLEWANGLQSGQSGSPEPFTPNAGEAEPTTLLEPTKQGTPKQACLQPMHQGTPLKPKLQLTEQGTPMTPSATNQPDLNQTYGMLRQIIAGIFGNPPTGKLVQCEAPANGQTADPNAPQNWGTCDS